MRQPEKGFAFSAWRRIHLKFFLALRNTPWLSRASVFNARHTLDVR